MEEVGQSYGYVLYRTTWDAPRSGTLSIDDVRDYALVFVDGRLAGTLDRRLGQRELRLEVPGTRLEILVENSGRVNFRQDLRTERKGILSAVRVDGRDVTGWETHPLPIDVSRLVYGRGDAARAPAFHRGRFRLRAVGDTFLDVRHWTKGAAWINGHALGRIWDIGPQRSLYVPSSWLIPGENEIVILDLMPVEHPVVSGRTQPLIDETPRPR
jgi:beta-galactosidase